MDNKIPAAIKDKDHKGRLMLRCPNCNAWDRNWEGTKGTVCCEECGEKVQLDGDKDEHKV